MRRMLLAASVLFLALTMVAHAQDSQSAKTTRKILSTKLDEFELKEVGFKNAIEELNRELPKGFRFFIDAASGVSNNSKVSFKKEKNVTVEKILNEISDKLDLGWYVQSNKDDNKVDGRVVFRKNTKGKERGYELGKEPK